MDCRSKLCTKCGVVKSISHFSKHSKRDDGLQGRCKECDKIYREKSKQKMKSYYAEYREKNRDYFNYKASRRYYKMKEEQFKNILK